MTSVVTAALVGVKRKKKAMEKAFLAADWDEVKKLDGELIKQLDAAFDEPSRDNRALVEELESVLGLYGRLVSSLPDSTVCEWLKNKI